MSNIKQNIVSGDVLCCGLSSDDVAAMDLCVKSTKLRVNGVRIYFFSLWTFWSRFCFEARPTCMVEANRTLHALFSVAVACSNTPPGSE
jgi:hypothetical protein